MSKRSKTEKAEAESKAPSLEDQIEELEARARELGVDTAQFDLTAFDDESPELRHAFWRDVVAFESADPTSPFAMLERSGIELPDPDSLDDEALGPVLERVIRGMAFLGTYLHHTDHLSDRQLYFHLWHDSLREPTVLMPENPNFGYHLDLTGSGSDEDMSIHLRYYADEEERQQWASENPDFPMPEAEDPPYDRDRLLPEQALVDLESEPAS